MVRSGEGPSAIGPVVPGAQDVALSDSELGTPSQSWARRLLPWVVSLSVVGWLLFPYRSPAGRALLFDAFARASPWTFAVGLFGTVCIWLTDSYATARTFQRWGTRIGLGETCLIRGATALFDAINPALGQAVLTVVVYRRGTPLSHTLVVVLLMNLVFVVQIALVSGVGLLAGAAPTMSIVPTVVTVALAATAVYLLVVALRFKALSRYPTFEWLMEAGLAGHGWAFLYRVPNMAVLITCQILYLRCFGIEVPWSVALFYVPAVMFIVGVPISVQGLGPSQMASVAFFASYAGGDPATAEATVLAYGFASTTLTTFAAVLIGLCCVGTETGRRSIAAVRAPFRRAEGQAP